MAIERIPLICGPQSPVPTELGLLPAERALAFNQPALLLHGPAATRPGHVFSAAELAGYGKTASRLLVLLGRFPWAGPPIPLHWESPEALLFRCRHSALVYDLAMLSPKGLPQLETIQIQRSALRFQRC